MKRLAGLTLIAVLAFCGCASSGGEFEKSMNSHKGRHINDYIAKSGPPQAVHSSPGGGKQYIYLSSKNVDKAAQPAQATSWTSPRYRVTCALQLFTDQRDYITDFSFSGDGCEPVPANDTE